MMLTLVLISAFTLASCGGDDDDDDGAGTTSSNKLVGTWSGTITQGDDTFSATITINADGTYVEKSASGLKSFSGTWKDNGNGTVTLTGFFDPTFPFTISGNNLTFNGDIWSGKFTRK